MQEIKFLTNFGVSTLLQGKPVQIVGYLGVAAMQGCFALLRDH